MSAKAVAVLATLLCAAGGALALANAGGDEEPRRAAARTDAGEPLEIKLKPAHRSGVSGTARLVQGRAAMEVTLRLDEPLTDTLLTHIHTGPCSDEPTFSNPRIWANLDDVIDGRSETTVNVVTLGELRAEGASINVHDPDHDQRALVCGDVPRDSEEAPDAS
jgi:hypothetical protein